MASGEAPHQAERSRADGRKIPRRRQNELRELAEANVKKGRAPYADATIQTREELLWILDRQRWIGGKRASDTPADLRFATLLDLSHVRLERANLERANLEYAKLDGVVLIGASLRGARFNGAQRGTAQFIGEQRIEELQAQRPAYLAPDDPPFAGVEVRTRNDLLWLAQQSADLRGINLQHADVFDTDLDDHDLTDALENIITDERKRELMEARQANEQNSKPPFAGVRIATRQELAWLTHNYRHTQSETEPKHLNLEEAVLTGGTFAGTNLSRAKLRKARLDGADLRMAQLAGADLVRASLFGAQLDDADLLVAKLPRARLDNASLRGANLFEADLRNAGIVGANLQDAHLSVADLRGTDCRGANCCGADLRGAKVDAATSFIDIQVNSTTQFGDIVWFDVPLLQFIWRSKPRLGDESALDEARTPQERQKAYRDIMRAYRALWNTLHAQGFFKDASRLRLREKTLERYDHRDQKQWSRWVMSHAVHLLTGYGEQAWRIVPVIALVITVFTSAYLILPQLILPQPNPNTLTFPQAIVLGVTGLLGQERYPQGILAQHKIGTIVPLMGTFETGIGWVILLSLTVLWSRRLLGER